MSSQLTTRSLDNGTKKVWTVYSGTAGRSGGQQWDSLPSRESLARSCQPHDSTLRNACVGWRKLLPSCASTSLLVLNLPKRCSKLPNRLGLPGGPSSGPRMCWASRQNTRAGMDSGSGDHQPQWSPAPKLPCSKNNGSLAVQAPVFPKGRVFATDGSLEYIHSKLPSVARSIHWRSGSGLAA